MLTVLYREAVTMLTDLFKGIFDSSNMTVISVGDFLLCLGIALLIGAAVALTAASRKSFSRSFLITLAALPALVCVTIMMVNGNIGAGVATAGAFSLIRFRSQPGTAREIALIFLAMVAGLVAGMGYLAYAMLFTMILCLIFLVLNRFDPESRGLTKTLRITIPEDLDYDGVFDGLMKEYCKTWKLQQVKTVNMGSLFRLTYQLTLKDSAKEKAFLDALRCHNGNLEISMAQGETVASEL